MSKNNSCECGKAPRLIYACSGAADVGIIADRISRELSKEGLCKMSCLAGVGARLPGFIESAKSTNINITIDGCSVACSQKILENLELKPKSFILTDMGMVKGHTPFTEIVIKETTDKIKKEISNGGEYAT